MAVVLISLLLIIVYIVMSSIMIILERDKPRNMIIWLIVFLFTSLLGGIIYTVFRVIIHKKRQSLLTKCWEDDVYTNLIQSKIINNDVKTNDDFFEFNKLAFNANLTKNNSYEFFDNYSKFKTSLIEDIKYATNYILLEVTKVNAKDVVDIKNALIEQAQNGVVVKFVYDRINSKKMLKQLKQAGVRVQRFSKFNTLGHVFANLRNSISIDGKIAYVGSLDVKNRELNNKYDILNTYIKFKGNVVQDIDISMRQDIVFATNKFIEYSALTEDVGNGIVQFVANNSNSNIELLIIKAICTAKKCINLQLEEFIPTESIMALLKFAINSNISVNLMVPLKTNRHSKYFASRAYAKELALMGANVYLYDGFIHYNAITIDSNYVLFGSYTMDREHIASSLQNVVVLKDDRAINYFTKSFSVGVENSYRIANAKNMLLRERFFKNFV